MSGRDPTGTMLGGDAAAVLAALLSALDGAVCVLDGGGCCIAATSRFARRLGREPDEIAGHVIDLPAAAEVRPLPGVAEWRLASLPAEQPDLRAVLDLIPAMVNVKDRGSRYRFMNAYQAQLYGVDPVAAVGCTAGEILGRGYGSYTRSLDQQVIDQNRPTGVFEEQYAGVDGVLRHWMTSKLPLHGADGAVDGVVTLAVDISGQKTREAVLADEKRSAEAAARARSRYLANAGHELRTPLNAIVGFAEFLAKETLGPLGNPIYKEYAGDVLAAGRHLLDIVNDLTDMARLEAGRMVLEEELIDLERIVADVVRMLSLPLARKRLVLDTEVPEALPHLLADARRMRQILINLLSNAVKFTAEMGRISVRAGIDEDGGIVLAVTDTGVGIAPEDIAVALMPFGRVVSPGMTAPEGTGLGLPLVRALVECHGGRLVLDSEPGRGTTVCVHIPKYRLRPRGLIAAADLPAP